MADNNQNIDEVRILPPDMALLKKLGAVMLDSLFSSAAIEKAQEKIGEAAEDFFTESTENFIQLETTAREFFKDPILNKNLLNDIIARSFALKTQAGLGDFHLAAALANSLHARCEALGDANMTPTNVAIMKWHIDSLKQILPLRIKGNGGDAGEAILAELKNLAAYTPPV